MRFLLLLYYFFSFAVSSQAQVAEDYWTVSGTVRDDSTGMPIPGAGVYVKETLQGTVTDAQGFFSMRLREGEYTLMVQFVGYESPTQTLRVDRDIRLELGVKMRPVAMPEVVITGEELQKNIMSAEPGMMEVSLEEIRSLPALLGEPDLLHALMLLPGVKSAGEASVGFYVRGGGPDQNLVLLDDAPVYNSSHLLGFFSVFNPDAIDEVTLIKGGIPPRYGGRLSSVLDITTRKGDMQRHHFSGSAGLIATRLALDGPLVPGKVSFMGSARRSYLEEISRPFMRQDDPMRGSGYYFYDLNGRVDVHLSPKNFLTLSGYNGLDAFNFKNKVSGFTLGTSWGNSAAALQWMHLFSHKITIKNTLLYSGYRNNVNIRQGILGVRLISGITDVGVKTDVSYFPVILHFLRFGVHYTYHTFIPTTLTEESGVIKFAKATRTNRLYSHDISAYASDDYDLSEKVRLAGGLRYSHFSHTGPFDRYVKNEFRQLTDTLHYGEGEIIQSYNHIEPRLSLRYALNFKSSLKASFTQNYQYIHLASYTTVSLPSDIWVPSTSIVKPQFSTQYTLGYFRNFYGTGEGTVLIESSLEGYYKKMENQLEYRDGYAPEDELLDNPDNNLVFGTGYAYGAEAFIRKVKGKMRGWIGYTLSWTQRSFPDINNGEKFFAKYDRRHDLAVLFTHQISAKWSASTVFVYATGNALTLPVARYVVEGNILDQVENRNTYRMVPYHRLDVSVNYTHRKTDKYESVWTFSVYNVYNRQNPYFIYFTEEKNAELGTIEIRAKQVSLAPVIPAVAWRFAF